MKKWPFYLFISLALFVIFIVIIFPRNKKDLPFDGEIALNHIETQLSFGPRTPGSEGHQQTIDWIRSTLQEDGWATEMQEEDLGIYTVQNIVARREINQDPWIIIAAHYDTRFFADQDQILENQKLPVPGANDGASGVAILLELARVLPKSLEKNVWLVFFDAEDQGRIDGWDWILGSTSFVNQLTKKPDQVVIIDMVADADLNLFYERNSDQQLREQIWKVAKDQGYEDFFIPTIKYAMLDDHIPFINAGIHAVDIIDFDYDYWHTRADSIQNVSPKSLQIVGDTLYHWLMLP